MFSDDSSEEIRCVENCCAELGVKFAISDVWRKGAVGGLELAEAVLETMNSNNVEFNPLYDPRDPVFEKLNKLATVIYGASGVSYDTEARNMLEKISRDPEIRFYPICMAKTQYSLSDNKNLRGEPRNFEIFIKNVVPMVGAEFITTYAGDIITMPGLPRRPASESINLNGEEISGLF
jgi:formate--tetrahydrofolate ligase